MKPIKTDRLCIEPFTEGDAAFIVALLNDPDWLRFIGDKNVRTLDDAVRYLRSGPLAMYEARGYGLCRVVQRASRAPLGMCGLLKRDGLDDVELGFAFLPAGRGQGHGREAAAAVVSYGFDTLALSRIVAITRPDNSASASLLKAIGMRVEGRLRLPPDGREVQLFALASNQSTTPTLSTLRAGSPRRAN